MAARPKAAAIVVVLFLMGCATGGGNLPPDPNAPPGSQGKSGVTLGQRATSALEGALMGAVIGGQMGPIGMAVGAAGAMIYSAITGQVPFSASPSLGGGTGPSERDREIALESEIEEEMARQASLESEIEDELARQEDLLGAIDQDERAPAPIDPVPAEPRETEVDPRVAPKAPADRSLPAIVFDEERVEVSKGTWENDEDLDVVKRSLDADRDGTPEQVRYLDVRTGQMIRKEQDRDYDGKIDAWQSYERGAVSERALDENDDGAPDVWEQYAGDSMISREVDRDFDGRRDAFYDFEQGSLVEERHDTSGDGNIDLVVTYRDRVRLRAEEDSSKDGRVDTWTSYQTVGDKEVISRVERDKDGSGQPNVFETYEPASDGSPQLTKREEDVNGDGNIDVTSVYENGKLVRREVTDPGLVPL